MEIIIRRAVITRYTPAGEKSTHPVYVHVCVQVQVIAQKKKKAAKEAAKEVKCFVPTGKGTGKVKVLPRVGVALERPKDE